MSIFDNYYKNLNNEIKEYFQIISPEFPDFIKPYIETNTMQRLKDVEYLCGMSYASKTAYNFKYYLSRLDHSISTALMVWQHTKDKKQTLAALFHDAGTPAFAHVIDYLNDDLMHQESTEIDLQEIIDKDRDLLNLLQKDCIKITDLTNYKKYPIVDCKRPKLCADRLDGIFITSLVWAQNTTTQEIAELYREINIEENEKQELEFSLKNKKSATRLIELNNIIDDLTHSDADYYAMNQMAKIIQKLIDTNQISYEDLYILTDSQIIKITKQAIVNDKELEKLFRDFTQIEIIPLQTKPPIKHRIIDPLVKGIRYSKI